MSYDEQINALSGDAERLEALYQSAVQAGEGEAFHVAIESGYAVAPDNLLLAAWFYRLRVSAEKAKSFAIRWAWVIPLAVLNGLIFWWFSDETRYLLELETFNGRTLRGSVPALVLFAAPLSALFVLAYFALIRKQWRNGILIAGLLLLLTFYVVWIYPQTGTIQFQEQYLNLMALHLPLLAWAGVGIYLLADQPDFVNHFKFLAKSLELFGIGGAFMVTGVVFTGITFGLFSTLGVDIPDEIARVFIAGGLGILPIVITAFVYNPAVPPSEQTFDEGLGKLVGLLMRILLILSSVVLLVYILLIPFNFREPFENRDVLITYNAVQFAVIAMLVGATPITRATLSPRLARWLRYGMLTVATLTLIVSIYALTAILYRTAIDRLTPNRLTFIGWNVINVGLLFFILLRQWRVRHGQWVDGLYSAFSRGTVAYVVWIVVTIVLVPWLFGIDQGDVESLPESVQRVIYEKPVPVLLRCSQSPHIYVLEDGEKRWIDTIDTFDERGYVWRDVHSVPCADLRAVPDGVSIPAEAGTPPQP